MASSIIISTVKQLGGMVAKEGQYLYEVSDKIERLQRDLRWMHCFLEDADNRQHRERVVAMWVAEIRDFAYEAEEVVERYVHKVSHPRVNGPWNTVKWFSCALCDARQLHDVGSKIDDLRNRITELITRLQLYGLKISNKEGRIHDFATWKKRETYSYSTEEPVGLEKHTKEMVHKLVCNDDVRFLGICGMGGLGKTTLARQVFHNESTAAYFSNCAWICVSEHFEARVVFREMLMRLVKAKDADRRTELSGVTDDELVGEISGILTQKKCLVVVDDLWKKRDWDALKDAFKSIENCGSKILITTRHKDVLEHAKASSHDLNLLSDEDSWNLFTRTASSNSVGGKTGNNQDTLSLKATTESDSISREEETGVSRKNDSIAEEATVAGADTAKTKEQLGREMLKHCKGLPLAILTLRGILSNKKTISEWEAVQNNIASYLMGDIEHGAESDELFAILELSYKDLPYYLKPCFMYLGNFPEDYEIRADRLFHLWEAEGLVTVSSDDGDEIQQVCLDDIARSHLHELVKRCLVQVAKSSDDGRIISCKLHDVMRDVCLKKCKAVNFLNIVQSESPKEISSKTMIRSSHGHRKLRRCAFYISDTGSGNTPFNPSPKYAPCIRSLVVFQNGQDMEPKKLFSSDMSKMFSLLRVLDLQDACITMHSRIFEDLIHLRYISLKNARLIPFLPPHIWDSPYLETVDLRWYTEFKKNTQKMELSNMFCKLERLRHLYLPPSITLADSKRLTLTETQLQQMETLKNFNARVCRIEDLHKMKSLRVFTIEFMAFLRTNEEVDQLLKSPMVVKNCLVKPLHLRVAANMFHEKKSELATNMDGYQTRSGFDVQGQFAFSDLKMFDKSLAKLLLSGSELGQEGISVLENLSHLKKFTLESMIITAKKLSFSGGGFKQLDILNILNPVELEEMEIENGALPKLQRLVLLRCVDLKMVPVGLPESVRVWCQKPCIQGVERYNICRHSTEDVKAS